MYVCLLWAEDLLQRQSEPRVYSAHQHTLHTGATPTMSPLAAPHPPPRTRVDRQPLAEVLPGWQPHRILHRPRAQGVLNGLLEREALGTHRHILDRPKGAALPATNTRVGGGWAAAAAGGRL